MKNIVWKISQSNLYENYIKYDMYLYEVKIYYIGNNLKFIGLLFSEKK